MKRMVSHRSHKGEVCGGLHEAKHPHQVILPMPKALSVSSICERPEVRERRLVSSQVVGLIKRHGHLKKYLHCQGEPSEGTAKHLLPDRPAITRECYVIFGGMDKGSEFPQEDLIHTSGMRQRLFRLKFMAIGRP
ncbi:hypothetical protein J6590_006438 [Homalodisca vitripennis]|nr:hypothetical protein J6590_006438 [Homalodisca vitripennis]